MAKNFGAPSNNVYDLRSKGDREDRQRSTLRDSMKALRSREDIGSLQSPQVNRISKGSLKPSSLEAIINDIMNRKK